MLIVTDPADPTPIYRQIAEQITEQIRDGTLAPGSKLPTAGTLAASLGLNRNTVLQTYRLLRDDGLIDLRRGRGALVRDRAPAADELDRILDPIVRYARANRLSLDVIIQRLSQKGLQ